MHDFSNEISHVSVSYIWFGRNGQSPRGGQMRFLALKVNVTRVVFSIGNQSFAFNELGSVL